MFSFKHLDRRRKDPCDVGIIINYSHMHRQKKKPSDNDLTFHQFMVIKISPHFRALFCQNMASKITPKLREISPFKSCDKITLHLT